MQLATVAGPPIVNPVSAKSPKFTSGGLDARRSPSRQCKVLRDPKSFGSGDSLRFRAGLTAGIKPAARGYSDRLLIEMPLL